MGEKIVILTDSLDGPGRVELDVSTLSDEELLKYALGGDGAAAREIARRLGEEQ